jgi:Zn-dependent peptidase ImmA (M78 family)
MDDAINYLLNFAMKQKIGFVWTNLLAPDTPSAADCKEREIVINANWHNQKELPFVIAHEIAHVLNKDMGILYFTSSSSKSQIESNANAGAIKILVDYCDKLGLEHYNIIKFMDVFGIPANLEYMVVDKLENRFEI